MPEEYTEEAKAIIGMDFEKTIASEESEVMLSDSTCPACWATELETKNYTRKFAALTLLISIPLFFS